MVQSPTYSRLSGEPLNGRSGATRSESRVTAMCLKESLAWVLGSFSGGRLVKTHCRRSRQSAYWFPNSFPITSRSWQTSTCPFLTMAFVNCPPDTRHSTSHSMSLERRAQLTPQPSIKLPPVWRRSIHIADAGSGDSVDRRAAYRLTPTPTPTPTLMLMCSIWSA